MPGSSRLLTHSVPCLCSCGTFRLLGSLTEAETGAAAVLPLTEHASLLGLLLALAGTCPSLRQQRFTFQVEEAAAPATAPHQQPGDDPTLAAVPAAAAAAAATLSTSVFSEAPDPFALTDGSAAVAVLLPQELGLPSEAFAGAEDVQVAQGLGHWRRRRCCAAFHAAGMLLPCMSCAVMVYAAGFSRGALLI